MDARTVAHPSDDMLKALSLGKLDNSTAADSVLQHVETCVDCRGRIAALSGDNFLQGLRDAREQSDAPIPTRAPSDFDRAIQAAQQATTTPPTVLDLPPELRNHPQYEVQRELGRGGMGIVYLARNKLMDRLEVLKVVNQKTLDRAGAMDRFLREIRSAAKLNHPNVVIAHNALQLGVLLVFAMEYVPGEDLAKVVKNYGGPLPVLNACYYVQQAVLGLQHAFEKGMVHRDIKPHNLILAKDGKKHIVKILDFGLAKARSEGESQFDLTGAGQMLGTPDYMAPEQWRDAANADIRADIYSLGCTLYFLLAGHVPFKARSLPELWQAHQNATAPSVQELRPEVPPELAAVVARMLAKKPEDRYQTPIEVAQSLLAIIKPGAKGASAGSSPSPPVATPVVSENAKPQELIEAIAEAVRRDTVTEGRATIGEARKRPDKQTAWPSLVKTAAKRKRLLVAGGIVAVLLLLTLLGLWAGGVFKVKTADGILVVQVNEPNAEVFVDGERVAVSWNDGGTKAEVHVKPGTRKVEVKKDGFSVAGKELTFKDGDREIFTAQLLPEQVAKADAPPPPTTPRSDYDDLAKGRWVAVLPSVEEFDRLRTEKAIWRDEPKFVGGVLQCNDSTMFFPPIQAKDAIVRAWVTKPGPKNTGSVALKLRVNNDGQVGAFFGGSGFFGIGRYITISHAWKDLQTCQFSEQYDGAFEFAFAAVGDRLIVYANGRKILEARDEAPPDRPAAVGVGTIGFGLFRDIEVQVLDKPPADAARPPPAAPAVPDKAAVAPGAGARKNPIVTVETSLGKIKIELYPDNAPVTVENFLSYVDEKFYDGTILHRVIDKAIFVIQGGGFTAKEHKEKDTKAPIKNESDNALSNTRGAIGMARTDEPNSATSQFYINVADNSKFFDKTNARDRVGYCVFGRVIEGMDVVDKINAVKTDKVKVITKQSGTEYFPNMPVDDVVIKSIRRIDNARPIEGFLPLFNGEDLTGWKTHPKQPGNWRVVKFTGGNALTGSSNGVSHLYTERGDYRDFHLRLEARINDEGNTGVYFRAPFGPSIPLNTKAGTGELTWVRGYNAKLDKNRNGGLLIDANPELHRTREAVFRPGEWITCEIIAEGNHIVIKVNGQTTSDYTDEQRVYTTGHIVLQQHGAATVAEFRKIEIKELNTTKPAPAEEPGRDEEKPKLDRKARIGSGSWKLEKGELVHTDAAAANCCILFGDPNWTDYDYSFEVVKTNGLYGISALYRASNSKNFMNFDLAGWQNRKYGVECFVDGKQSWITNARATSMAKDRKYRVLVSVRGDCFRCYVDGGLIYDFQDGRHARGAVGFRCWGAAVRVGAIKVSGPDGKILWEGPPELADAGK